MFYDKSITIYSPGESQNIGGGVMVPGELTEKAKVKVDIQPYSKAQALMEYGFDIEVSHTVFMPIMDVVVGVDVIKYLDVLYDVTQQIVWDDYQELMINRRL